MTWWTPERYASEHPKHTWQNVLFNDKEQSDYDWFMSLPAEEWECNPNENSYVKFTLKPSSHVYGYNDRWLELANKKLTLDDQIDSDVRKRVRPDAFYQHARYLEDSGLEVMLRFVKTTDDFMCLKVMIHQSPEFMQHLLVPYDYALAKDSTQDGFHITLSDFQANDDPDLKVLVHTLKDYFTLPRPMRFTNVHVMGTIELWDQPDYIYELINSACQIYKTLKHKHTGAHVSLD